MAYVIGLDFGNYNSFPCFISDIDFTKGRLGGNVHDLLPPEKQDGIPSAFFYAEKIKKTASTKPLPWCGDDAVSLQARPVKNRVRLLKRHLGETFTLDDKTFTYDEAITQVVQYCVRRANKVLKANWLTETNLVALSYPATYTHAQRQRLIELVEKATLENGTKVKVFGTIAEPAAAALDYLAGYVKKEAETTVLTYDLGGGTFDLALVAAYPQGRKNANGNLYYYGIINTRGIGNLGGVEFDTALYELMLKQAGRKLKENQQREIQNKVEEAKKELSRNTETVLEYFDPEIDDYEQIMVTRAQFEKATYALVKQTIDKTKEMLKDHQNQKPAYILLTGGASQMPMIRKEMEKAFPEYIGKIIDFRPTKAIAYGAARFGAVEEDTSASPIQQRTMYDLGIRFYRSKDDKKGYISTYIKAGEVIPHQTVEHISHTLHPKQRYSHYAVYEAKVSNPNTENVYTDYTEIMAIDLDHERECPIGTESKTKLMIDKLGQLTIESWECNKPDRPLKKTITLKNLS